MSDGYRPDRSKRYYPGESVWYYWDRSEEAYPESVPSYSTPGKQQFRSPAIVPRSEQVNSTSIVTREKITYCALVTLMISASFGFALIVLVAGYVSNLAGIRVAGIFGIIFFGVGAAPLQLSKYPLAFRLGVAGILSLSILTVVGDLMALVPIWQPVPVAAALIVASIGVHSLGCYRAVREVRPPLDTVIRYFRRALMSSSILCTFAGSVLWCAATFSSGRVVPAVGGFLPDVSPLWYVGLVLVVLGIVLARGKPQLCVAFGVVSLVAGLTVTPGFLYGTPPLSAAKHIDLVQLALSHHGFNRNASIYEAYSGFFAAISWVCSLVNLHDSLTLAAYWPFIISLVSLIELRFLFGTVIQGKYRAWVGVTFAVVTISVGSLYFAPQSVGFVLGLGIYGLCLGYRGSGFSNWACSLVLVFAGCALAVTHELSPFVIGGALIVLAAFRVAQPWYSSIACLLPATLWAVLNWHEISSFVVFTSLGNLSNFAPPKTVPIPGLHRLPIVGVTSYSMLIGVLLLIVLATISFSRSVFTRPTSDLEPAQAWAFMISAGVGLFPIAVNPYGHEGIFRATLFAIPWLVMLSLASLPAASPGWTSPLFGVLAASLLPLQLVSSFGLDNANIIRPADFQAYSIYMSTAPSSSFILDMSYGPLPFSATFPDPSHLVEWTTLASRGMSEPGRPDANDAAMLAAKYAQLAVNVGGDSNAEMYALWSPASVEYSVDYGLESFAQAEKWRMLMITSHDWKVVFSKDGTYLFQLVVDAQKANTR